MSGSKRSGAKTVGCQAVDRQTVDHDRNAAVRNNVDRSAVDRNNVDRSAVDRKSFDRETVQRESVQSRAIDCKANGPKAAVRKTVDRRTIDRRTIDRETIDPKTIDRKTIDPESADSKSVDRKTVRCEVVNRDTVGNEAVDAIPIDGKPLSPSTRRGRQSRGRLIRRYVSLLFAVTLASAHARDWVDFATTPWVDPLLAYPPQLESGKTLPGDGQPYQCNPVAAFDPSVPLTLAAALDTALCNNPQVHSAWIAIKVQAAQVGEARAAWLPTLTLGASRLHQRSRQPESLFTVNTERDSVARYLTLTWRLLDMGGRDANRRAADALLDAALAGHDAALQTTMAKTIGAYFDAQTAKAAHAAKAKGESIARQTLETAQKREAGGVGARSDTLQAQSALAQAELGRARSLGAWEKSRSALAAILGLPQQALAAGIVLADDNLDAVHVLRDDLAAWLDLAREQHPALLAARSRLLAAREKLIATRSEGLPTIDFTHSRYVNGLPNQGLSSSEMRQTYSGVTLNIPLFEGFGRTYKVRGAQAQVQLKEAELREVESQVLEDVASVHADAVAALRNLESSARLIAAATAALVEVQKKYQRGVADVLEMLNVQASVAQAEQEQVRAWAEWRSARLRLLASAGVLGRKDVPTR